MKSDAKFNKLSPDQKRQVERANQQLCDGLNGLSIPWWNFSEKTAALEMHSFFYNHVPKEARCH